MNDKSGFEDLSSYSDLAGHWSCDPRETHFAFQASVFLPVKWGKKLKSLDISLGNRMPRETTGQQETLNHGGLCVRFYFQAQLTSRMGSLGLGEGKDQAKGQVAWE